jgi:hypothetical protein
VGTRVFSRAHLDGAVVTGHIPIRVRGNRFGFVVSYLLPQSLGLLSCAFRGTQPEHVGGRDGVVVDNGGQKRV